MSRCDFKIVLLGSEHVGKTSLVLRFVNCRFNSSTPYQNTIGAAFCAKTVQSDGRDFNVGVWDTAGSERVLLGLPRHCSASGMFADARVDCFFTTMRKRCTSLVRRLRATSNNILSIFANRYEAMTRMYYRGAHAAIICYEVSSLSSWQRLRHWLQELRTVEEDCKVYLCGTKKDLLDTGAITRQVPEDIIATYSQDLGGHFLTSSKTGENVDELFQKIVDDCVADAKMMKNVEELRVQLRKDEDAYKSKNKEFCFC